MHSFIEPAQMGAALSQEMMLWLLTSYEHDDDALPESLGVKCNKSGAAADKKARKQALKAERGARRETKMATTGAFKTEAKKQQVTIDRNPRYGLKVKQLD